MTPTDTDQKAALDANWPLPSFEALEWAKAFCQRFPSVSEDDVIGWFANALMRGFDEGDRRAALQAAQVPITEQVFYVVRWDYEVMAGVMCHTKSQAEEEVEDWRQDGRDVEVVAVQLIPAPQPPREGGV